MNPLAIKLTSQLAWDALREQMCASLDGCCWVCGNEKPESELAIHHKDSCGLNNSKDNLLLACRSCHMKLHGGKTYKEVYLENSTNDSYF